MLVPKAAYGERRDVLNELRRPCAYVNCVETTRTRTMLATILQQLKVRTAPRHPVLAVDFACGSGSILMPCCR